MGFVNACMGGFPVKIGIEAVICVELSTVVGSSLPLKYTLV